MNEYTMPFATPMTYSTILELLKPAADWCWHRDNESLDIFHDDIPGNRRVVYHFYLKGGYGDSVELTNFNAAKNRWDKVLDERRRQYRIINKQGNKALREFIRAASMAEKGLPNCEYVYKPRPELKPAPAFTGAY